MSDLFEPPDDAATLLNAEEMRGLIPTYVAYRHELNAAEQENILRGLRWVAGRKRDLLSEKFVKDLHKHMFGNVWRWAGAYRKAERNIGIDFWEIPVAMRHLLDDAKAWVELGSYAPDEIAVRFHHRLVQIHPFPNGNGRHSRLMADLLAARLGRGRFSWGRESLQDAGATRRRYICALQAADRHEMAALLAFARD